MTTECTFTVHAENVTDQDTDDPPNAMAADHVVTFQTVAAPPVIDDAPAVESTSPGDGAVDVARGASLSVTFDEPVDVSGDWFDITCADEPRSHRGRERWPRHVHAQPRHRLRL